MITRRQDYSCRRECISLAATYMEITEDIRVCGEYATRMFIANSRKGKYYLCVAAFLILTITFHDNIRTNHINII